MILWKAQLIRQVSTLHAWDNFSEIFLSSNLKFFVFKIGILTIYSFFSLIWRQIRPSECPIWDKSSLSKIFIHKKKFVCQNCVSNRPRFPKMECKPNPRLRASGKNLKFSQVLWTNFLAWLQPLVSTRDSRAPVR